MWVGHTQSVEGLDRTKADLPEDGEFCQQMACGLKLHLCPESACWPALQTLDLPASITKQANSSKVPLYIEREPTCYLCPTPSNE